LGYFSDLGAADAEGDCTGDNVPDGEAVVPTPVEAEHEPTLAATTVTANRRSERLKRRRIPAPLTDLGSALIQTTSRSPRETSSIRLPNSLVNELLRSAGDPLRRYVCRCSRVTGDSTLTGVVAALAAFPHTSNVYEQFAFSGPVLMS
jgi:hypothetical protein